MSERLMSDDDENDFEKTQIYLAPGRQQPQAPRRSSNTEQENVLRQARRATPPGQTPQLDFDLTGDLGDDVQASGAAAKQPPPTANLPPAAKARPVAASPAKKTDDGGIPIVWIVVIVVLIAAAAFYVL
ncbi:MAG: hypothetical protein H6978_02695 [Gammaproteobacteria bacterium]|nr:hypothetical protein [Gammaproteobacteria bacterium]